jgi:hypothetical protein
MPREARGGLRYGRLQCGRCGGAVLVRERDGEPRERVSVLGASGDIWDRNSLCFCGTPRLRIGGGDSVRITRRFVWWWESLSHLERSVWLAVALFWLGIALWGIL